MRAAETPAGFAVLGDWPTRERSRQRLPEHATRSTQQDSIVKEHPGGDHVSRSERPLWGA